MVRLPGLHQPLQQEQYLLLQLSEMLLVTVSSINLSMLIPIYGLENHSFLPFFPYNLNCKVSFGFTVRYRSDLFFKTTINYLIVALLIHYAENILGNKQPPW